jgi:hypothetical protein
MIDDSDYLVPTLFIEVVGEGGLGVLGEPPREG